MKDLRKQQKISQFLAAGTDYYILKKTIFSETP